MDIPYFNIHVISLFVVCWLCLCRCTDKSSDRRSKSDAMNANRDRREAIKGIYLFGNNSSEFIPLPDLFQEGDKTPVKGNNEKSSPTYLTGIYSEEQEGVTVFRKSPLTKEYTTETQEPDLNVDVASPVSGENMTDGNDYIGAWPDNRLPLLLFPGEPEVEQRFNVHGHGVKNTHEGSLTENPDNLKYSDMLSADIEERLQSDTAQVFIMSLLNDFQREVVLTNLRQCPFIPLCNFDMRLDSKKYIKAVIHCCSPCKCDNECVLYGSCCPDVPWFVRKPEALPQDVQETCIPQEIKSFNENAVRSIKALTGCPIRADPKLKAKCTNIYEFDQNDIDLDDIILVSDILSDRIYRNKYCAKCNFVNSSSVRKWLPKLNCLDQLPAIESTKELLTNINKGQINCYLDFMNPNDTTKAESCSDAISRCNETRLWKEYDSVVEMACGLYGSWIAVQIGSSEKLIFRNVFCAQCNGYHPLPIDTCTPTLSHPRIVSFSRLLRLNEDEQDVTRTCGSGELYDIIKRKCRHIVCSLNRFNVGGGCRLTFNITEEMYLDITVRLQPRDSTLSMRAAYSMVPQIKSMLLSTIRNKLTPFITCGMQIILHSNLNSQGDNSDDDNNFNYRNKLNASTFNFYDTRIQIVLNVSREKNIDSLLSLNGSTIELKTLHEVALPAGDSFDFIRKFELKLTHGANNYKFDQVASLEYFFLRDEIGGSNETIAIDDVFDYITLVDGISTSLQIPYLKWNDHESFCKYFKSIPLHSLRTCPMFRIPWTEYNLKENIDGIELVGSSIQLDISDFSIEVNETTSSNLLICVDTYLEKLKPFKSMKENQQGGVRMAKSIISIACVCISVTCLVISLITFCLFKQLQTLPGKNNIALIGSLIVAQVLYLVGGTGGFDQGTTICKTVGVLTHFFWLLAIFWMNVCTFHMCRVLLQTRNMAHAQSTRKYIYYHMYCIGMALLFVIINIVVSIVTSNNIDMGYGKVICFVSSQRMIDVTFGIPAALVVVANLGMFLAIVIKLKGGPAIQKNVKHDRSYFLIFIKLSTVTGITWVFGFVYMWTGFEPISFLFIIFNATQGLFIMLAFVCNRRTMALYEDRFRKRGTAIMVSTNRSNKTLSTSDQ